MESSASDSPRPGENTPSDTQLVEQTLAGKKQAFDTLIIRYQRQAVAVSYRLLGNMQDALEVTQDAFLKSFTSLHTLQKPGAFGGWLMRIVANLSLNFRRSRSSAGQLPIDDLFESSESGVPNRTNPGTGGAGDPLRHLESAELGEQLTQALNRLPEKQRLAIIMFTIEQMPQKQVAEALECTVEAVKWHVFQGRKKLKEMLKDVM